MEFHASSDHEGCIHDDSSVVEDQFQSKHLHQFPHDSDGGDSGLPEEVGRVGAAGI